MTFLASVLESYESLVAGRIGNLNMTKEDYDQIDPEGADQHEVDLTNLKSHASSAKKEATSRENAPNREVQGNNNPFGDDYYKKAIYHKTSQHPPSTSRPIQIEDGSSKAKDKALVVTHEDKGFNWNNYIPKTESLAMLAEIIEEPKQIVQEVVEEVGDEVCGEICFDVSFFSNQGNYSGMHREEQKKQHVEEITDVSKEMIAENLADIGDKAMMAQLKEVEKISGKEKTVESVKENVDSKKIEIQFQCTKCTEPCKSCMEKDDRIKELKKHIESDYKETKEVMIN
ncbi:hypothetical protein Hanom_Chr01g00039501 [Helianthus anomalus]